MHTDLSPHLHSPECNKLIDALKQCHQENSIFRFVGKCNTIDTELNKCLRNERKSNAANNRIRAAEKQRKIREQIKLEEKM